MILPYGTPSYRRRILVERRLEASGSSHRIRNDIKIVGDGHTCRILGAWIGNDVNYTTPWPEVLEKISADPAKWTAKKPLFEGRRHIINMVIGGRTQYLTRGQGMPRQFEDSLIHLRDEFLWAGKKPRIAEDTMSLPLEQGGKQILNIRARNEVIDL
jgi:hypothetical protein